MREEYNTLLSIKSKQTYYNLSEEELIQKALENNEGVLTNTGAFAVETGAYTGRSPKDRFIVDTPDISEDIAWGNVNQKISETVFDKLYEKVLHHLETKEIYVFDGMAGANKTHQLAIRCVNEFAWQNLFVNRLFIRPTTEELATHNAEFTVICAPTFKANPSVDGTQSEAFVLINFARKIVLIGGTHYAGEMKKSIFSVMNYKLPKEKVLSMHCSANVSSEGEVALFFGLSGTGKTTLSADPNRFLIGDDEHGWSESGVFNIEGGCYAKTIGLKEEKEPEIYRAITKGSVLENVIIDANGNPDYDNSALTENTRAAYPLTHIPNAKIPSVAGHPNTIIFLTADAFGVLPPISKLSKEQAMYYFLNGYTSKLAGTERGVTEPQATFSTCFGAPFLPLQPTVYATMLGDLIDKHGVDIYLVNTGWSGGSYGVGERMNLSYTRKMVESALNGSLKDAPMRTDSIFDLEIPMTCPGVPKELLDPMQTWHDKEAYIETALELKQKFEENYRKYQ